MMLAILSIISITVLGMLGGQIFKVSRRFILPVIASLTSVLKKKNKKWKSSVYLLLSPILCMGYGESSELRKLLGGNDKLTRVVYGFLVSIPFLLLGKWWACLLLPVAFSIRAGGFKLTESIDFLYEDLIRYGTLSILIVF